MTADMFFIPKRPLWKEFTIFSIQHLVFSFLLLYNNSRLQKTGFFEVDAAQQESQSPEFTEGLLSHERSEK